MEKQIVADLKEYIKRLRGSIQYNDRMIEDKDTSSRDRKEYRAENHQMKLVIMNIENIINKD